MTNEEEKKALKELSQKKRLAVKKLTEENISLTYDTVQLLLKALHDVTKEQEKVRFERQKRHRKKYAESEQGKEMTRIRQQKYRDMRKKAMEEK